MFSADRFEALHDIMKINLLLPSVQKSDAPYRGNGKQRALSGPVQSDVAQ